MTGASLIEGISVTPVIKGVTLIAVLIRTAVEEAEFLGQKKKKANGSIFKWIHSPFSFKNGHSNVHIVMTISWRDIRFLYKF